MFSQKNRICMDILQTSVYLSKLEYKFKTCAKTRLVGV